MCSLQNTHHLINYLFINILNNNLFNMFIAKQATFKQSFTMIKAITSWVSEEPEVKCGLNIGSVQNKYKCITMRFHSTAELRYVEVVGTQKNTST